MKILLTGSSGFLGRNIAPILRQKGYDLKTLARRDADYTADLAKEIPSLPESFDVVVHAAGKAHSVPRNDVEINEFFSVNVNGTEHLCKSLENNPPKIFIFISTVAVYGKDAGSDISEDAKRDGITPYAQSKIQAEDLLKNWCEKHKIRYYILRPALIAGKDAPGNLGAMAKGISSGYYFNIGGGKASKSVVWVDDFAEVIDLLVKKNPPSGFYNISGGKPLSFYEISNKLANSLGKGKPKNMPISLAKMLAAAGNLLGEKAPINSEKLNKIILPLTFSDVKIRELIGWKPSDVLSKL